MSDQNSGETPGAGGQDGKTPNGENGQPTAEQLATELASLRAALKAANAESATRRKKLDERAFLVRHYEIVSTLGQS